MVSYEIKYIKVNAHRSLLLASVHPSNDVVDLGFGGPMFILADVDQQGGPAYFIGKHVNEYGFVLYLCTAMQKNTGTYMRKVDILHTKYFRM